MKKNIIILVIILITISLLGLVGIQLYWIRNAVAVKEANFERGVSEAVTESIYKYNKIILAQKLLFQDKQNQQLQIIINSLDSLNTANINDSGINYVDDAILSDNLDNYLNLYNETYIEFRVKQSNIKNQEESTTTYSIPEGYRGEHLQDPESRELIAQSLLDRGRLINDLLEDLFSNDRNFRLSAGVTKAILDSLINIELGNQGIQANFEFGIYDPVSNNLSIEKTGKHSDKLIESGYVFNLFPNTIFQNPEYLLVYFPGQKNYILAQMSVLFLVSTVLIIVIISSFAYTIVTVIRQKKLSIMKNDFINNMTHELKTPISTISLACQALSDTDIQKSEHLYQNYINIIDVENQRLEMMTEKVLQTALLDKGKLKLNISYINIHDILDEAISKIGLQVQRSNGVIKTGFRAAESKIMADKFHLTNVFFNLLDNANKYTKQSPEIKVTTENNPEGIFVNIKDNGIGISMVNQQKVFDNLFRISTGNVHNVKGFGLGLAYVKNIVELHGGEVFLESEIKKGTTFTIFVPFGTSSRKIK